MKVLAGIVSLLLQRQVVAFTASRVTSRDCIKCSLLSMLNSKDAADEQARKEHKQTKTIFESPKFRVYIEDTDAYGVMYNSNYVRAYERALVRYAPLADGNRNDQSASIDKKWILSSIHNQKFRSSPALGEEYIIRGELVDEMSDDEVQTWELQLVTENESGAIVHNSACIAMISERNSILHEFELNLIGNIDEKRYTPYHDEFDHFNFEHGSCYIPLRNAMNFFERARSDFLGGPDALRKMQIEDDLIWVVTGVENGKLFTGDNSLHQESSNDNVSVGDDRPKEVIVQTMFDVKRRGMILDCHHKLWMEDGKHKILIGQATCVILALKGSTRRPTSKLPQWVLDKFVN